MTNCSYGYMDRAMYTQRCCQIHMQLVHLEHLALSGHRAMCTCVVLYLVTAVRLEVKGQRQVHALKRVPLADDHACMLSYL